MKTEEEIREFRNFVFNTLKHEPLPTEESRYPEIRRDQHRAFLVRTLKALDWVLGNDAAAPIFKVENPGVYETQYNYTYGLDETEEQLKCRSAPMPIT